MRILVFQSLKLFYQRYQVEKEEDEKDEGVEGAKKAIDGPYFEDVPEYSLHTKYAQLLNVVFVAMMFGTGMPILFPLAFGYICVVYEMEKFMLINYYKNLPVFDEALNE